MEKNIKVEFLATEEAIVYKKAHRLFKFSVFGVAFALVVTIFDVYYQTGLWNYLLNGLLFVFCAFFIWRTTIMKKAELNKYLSKPKPKSSVKKKSSKK